MPARVGCPVLKTLSHHSLMLASFFRENLLPIRHLEIISRLPAQMRKLIVSLPLTNDLNATSSLSINLPFNRPNRCGDYSAGSGLGDRG